MTFANSLPLVVKRVVPGSAAEKLGVERGWIVASISGVPVEARSFEEAVNVLKAGASALPMDTTKADALMPTYMEDVHLVVPSPSADASTRSSTEDLDVSQIEISTVGSLTDTTCG